MPDTVDIPDALIAALANARCVVIVTGAGTSAESGIPTFRDAMDGLWENHDPHQLASIEGFLSDPALVTRWYDERRVKVQRCKPNSAHHALTAMERHVEAQGRRFGLFTQNVDGLHQRAGSRRVHELHGSICTWKCTHTGRTMPVRGEAFPQYPPRSASGGIWRPAVVWFGEMLPTEPLQAAEKMLRSCDLFFSVGTSAQVYPAAALADYALQIGAPVAEINLHDTPLSARADWSLRARAGAVLPSLVAAAFGQDDSTI